MVEALLLAVIFIYLILASQFGVVHCSRWRSCCRCRCRWSGVMLALLLTGGTLNIMSMIGIIMLMGLVTKNAILLVDFANQRAARGHGSLARRWSRPAQRGCGRS